MPVFISYSHADKTFVDKLAAGLVEHNAHVWLDRWELNVGDSILNRVQQAIQESDALLIILSKASVASEWCKKELNAGLMRELDEKRVLVLPVLVEDCEIPIFLREKMYADFRGDFADGLKPLVEALARLTNPDQGRIRSGDSNIDWGEIWGYDKKGLFHVDYTLVETAPNRAFTLLTEIWITCNEAATRRYKAYDQEGFDWVGRLIIAEMLTELATKEKVDLLLQDQRPVEAKFHMKDQSSDMAYDMVIRSRRMGEDNGKDQLLHATNYLSQIRDYVRQRVRRTTPEENVRLLRILSSK
ncbi:MAG TPA: toll/interleukin-1 receptor domain-containing protein [Candidatus Angelobacter sp.]|nr:toll/interleukin-1 receptor domain-containing protein [Candidatus Angelobacter sp.]